VWGIVGISTATIAWACLAKIEEAVPAQGKLEPKGIVQPVQAPVSGIVKQVHVREGERVQQGQVLITLDPTNNEAQLRSLAEVRQKLIEENTFYRSQLESTPEVAGIPTGVSVEVTRLTSNRLALIEENELFRAILRGEVAPGGLSPSQVERVATSLGNINSQVEINQLRVSQLEQQLEQVRTQLDNAVQALAVEEEILGSISKLEEPGAVARLQVLRQEQEVNNRRTELNSLREEQQRLLLEIDEALEELQRTTVVSSETLLDRIAQNENQIANIDSQLTKVVVDNEKRLEEIDGQIDQLKFALVNEELRAPLDGQVFNLKANQPGYVTNPTEPILEIVPTDTLVARVFVTNQDIGFVRQQFDQQGENLQVDVRIDSFPFSEFGDVKGNVSHIGSDALPPDQVNPFYRFPVEIELAEQSLSGTLPLQSGMSVNANIKLRKRRVITILSDLFVRKLDSLRTGG
jgi:multidrug efflux pump subunit AcrA (membrane-fusion protein)